MYTLRPGYHVQVMGRALTAHRTRSNTTHSVYGSHNTAVCIVSLGNPSARVIYHHKHRAYLEEIEQIRISIDIRVDITIALEFVHFLSLS